jgi:hypothetical protein
VDLGVRGIAPESMFSFALAYPAKSSQATQPLRDIDLHVVV